MKRETGVVYIKLFLDYLSAIEPLSDAERGRLLTALLIYGGSGEVPKLSGNERFLFPMMKAQIDRDREAYFDISEKRSAAGRASATARKKSLVDSASDTGDNVRKNAGKEAWTGEMSGNDAGDSAGENEGEREGVWDGAGELLLYNRTNVRFAEKDNDEDEDKDKDNDEGKDNDDFSCVTTTTTRAHVHTARGEPPSFLAAAEYFRELCCDEPGREAEKFIAYNAYRHWDCLPDWQLAAELWAARCEPAHDPAEELYFAEWKRRRDGS